MMCTPDAKKSTCTAGNFVVRWYLRMYVQSVPRPACPNPACANFFALRHAKTRGPVPSAADTFFMTVNTVCVFAGEWNSRTSTAFPELSLPDSSGTKVIFELLRTTTVRHFSQVFLSWKKAASECPTSLPCGGLAAELYTAVSPPPYPL